MVLEISGGLFGQSDVREQISDTTITQSTIVKSIQYGTISITGSTNTAAITEIDTTNSMVLLLGTRPNTVSSSSEWEEILGRVELTNGTTVTGTRGDTDDTMLISFVVMEFHEGILKSNQKGQLTIASGNNTSGTAAINTVDVTKAFLVHNGVSTTSINSSTNEADENQTIITLTDATTITGTRGAADVSSTALITNYQIVEFN